MEPRRRPSARVGQATVGDTTAVTIAVVCESTVNPLCGIGLQMRRGRDRALDGCWALA